MKSTLKHKTQTGNKCIPSWYRMVTLDHFKIATNSATIRKLGATMITGACHQPPVN